MSDGPQTPEQLRVCASRLELLYSHKEEPLQRAIHAVASAYLAEHPADDAEPVDEAWLESVGFVHGDSAIGSPRMNSPRAPVDETQVVTIESDGAAYYDVDDGHWVILPDVETRGDVRRLCAALGIELTARA
jgi:hypothetical protein